MELSPVHIAILVAAVPMLAQAIKVIFAYWGKDPNREAITLIAFVLSLVTGGILAAPQLPPYSGDPMAFATELLKVAGVVFGLSTAVYNLILSRLFDALGVTPAAVKPEGNQ